MLFAMKIDKSYFIGDLNIEGLNVGCSPAMTGNILDAQFDGYIERHEPDYLLKMLGCSLFVDLAAYCEIDQRGSVSGWKHKLIVATNGIAPTQEEEFTEWLREIGNSHHVMDRKFDVLCSYLFDKTHSPVANYIYFQAVRQRHVTISSLGSTVASGDGKSVSPNYKLCLAWNAMAEMNITLHRYLLENSRLYQEYEPNANMLKTINMLGL
ncbi:hypothetical protein [Bacteroides neonati]|uniref:hypothetical protein n=1 Tax=Bacteroides neonati TaxID=1347393 RepID=UPI0005A821FB|nr:hypothetical protein [Bacteroides neonati]